MSVDPEGHDGRDTCDEPDPIAQDPHGRVALVCAGTREIQAMLVEQNPDAYDVPPYVGHRGWLGVRLDQGLPWTEGASLSRRPPATRRSSTAPR